MNKKLIGICVCILFFGASVCPSIAGYEKVIDKKETNDYNNLIKYAIESGVLSNYVWREQDKLLASDGATDDIFGVSVSIDGDYALIGAYGDDNGKGSAYVFKRDGTIWTEEQKLTASDSATNDEFGCSVSIDGDYALIGAPYDDSRGSAYVFKRDGTIWTEEQKLTASDSAADDIFGCSVSIDGDYALIGASSDDNGKGSAYMFKRDGTTWTEEQKLTASDSATNEYFGWSVSIDGDYALIGASGDDNGKGSAYMFKRDGTTWTEEQKLTASDSATNDWFGVSVSIDGDYALIGAPYDDAYKGSAYVFKRDGTIWTEEQKLTASDGATYDDFGVSVSIDGDIALIGAYDDDDSRGSAYVFKRDGTTWTEKQKLTASDGATYDLFGSSVSIDGDYALIGAPFDDYIKGSAYVFIKSENQPPNNPTISGPTNGKPNTEYDFTLNSVDSDGDDVRFHIDWSDGDSETSSFTSSGSNMVVSHIWTGQGTYTITVYAEDEFGAVSGTTTSQMIIEKSKTMSNPFLNWLQNHPNMFPLLQKLLLLIK